MVSIFEQSKYIFILILLSNLTINSSISLSKQSSSSFQTLSTIYQHRNTLASEISYNLDLSITQTIINATECSLQISTQQSLQQMVSSVLMPSFKNITENANYLIVNNPVVKNCALVAHSSKSYVIVLNYEGSLNIISKNITATLDAFHHTKTKISNLFHKIKLTNNLIQKSATTSTNKLSSSLLSSNNKLNNIFRPSHPQSDFRQLTFTMNNMNPFQNASIVNTTITILSINTADQTKSNELSTMNTTNKIIASVCTILGFLIIFGCFLYFYHYRYAISNNKDGTTMADTPKVQIRSTSVGSPFTINNNPYDNESWSNDITNSSSTNNNNSSYDNNPLFGIAAPNRREGNNNTFTSSDYDMDVLDDYNLYEGYKMYNEVTPDFTNINSLQSGSPVIDTIETNTPDKLRQSMTKNRTHPSFDTTGVIDQFTRPSMWLYDDNNNNNNNNNKSPSTKNELNNTTKNRTHSSFDTTGVIDQYTRPSMWLYDDNNNSNNNSNNATLTTNNIETESNNATRNRTYSSFDTTGVIDEYTRPSMWL